MTTANYEEFRLWLGHELEERGWNLAELARRSHITLAHLSRVMSGERLPGTTTCIGIARAFRIPPEDVLRRVGILSKPRGAIESTDELLYYFQQLSADDQHRLIVIARALCEASEKRS